MEDSMRDRVKSMGIVPALAGLACIWSCAVFYCVRPQVEMQDREPPFLCPEPRVERPVVNLPPGCRIKNWPDENGYGSCTHATTAMLLRWQGRPGTANWWKNNHNGGEYVHTLIDAYEAGGLRFADNSEDIGNVDFLQWACDTRRGAGVVVMGGRHMVALVHLDSEWAAILDNNKIKEFIWIPRDRFVQEWLDSGGWAITPVYSPMPPIPTFP
jgi:hypothetical protein